MSEEKGGRLPTSGLFKELITKGRVKDVCYSLDTFKKLFLETGDSSGYICAQELLFKVVQKNRWKEWQRIFSNPRMRDILESWQEELEIRTRADAEAKVTSGCDKETFARLRYILDGKVHSKRKVGRPTKGELTRKERVKEGIKDIRKQDPEQLDTVLKVAERKSRYA